MDMNIKENIKKAFKADTKPEANASVYQSKRLRIGGLNAVICAVVLAIVIVVNLVVGALPSYITKIDLSEQQLYTISQQTEEILASLDKEVTLYHISQESSKEDIITELLNNYKDMSDKITVKHIDPVLYPTFVGNYTNEGISDNSIIAESGSRFKIVDRADIVKTETEIDWSTYQEVVTSRDFMGEVLLSGAIDFVTRANLPKVYTLMGHGESALTEDLALAVENQSMVIEELNLTVSGAIPDDTSCLFIYMPTADITIAEKEMILDYLNKGGSLFLTTVMWYEELYQPNIIDIMENYGVTGTARIVVEENSNYHASGAPYALVPEMMQHDITQPLLNSGMNVIASIMHHIAQMDSYRSTLNITPLLTTSDSAYLKNVDSQSFDLSKAEGDEAGKFDLAYAISEQYGNDETRIVWASSGSFIMEDGYYGNRDFFLNCLSWASRYESGITIHAKSLASQEFLTLTDAQSTTLRIVFMFALPIIILAAGGIVWFRRRSK